MYSSVEKSTIENAAKIIADDLSAIQNTLEELYQFNEERFSSRTSEDFEAVKAVVSQLQLAFNRTLKSTVEDRANNFAEIISLLHQYQNLLGQHTGKYTAFSNEVLDDLRHQVLEIEFYIRFMVALKHLVRVEDHGKGMVLLSEALEYGISINEGSSYFPFFGNNLLDAIKDIAVGALESLETLKTSELLQPIASQGNPEQLHDLVQYKNAARSILWQANQFENANVSSQDLSPEEELELVREANQAMMEAWDLISQRRNNETNAQDHL